MKSFKLNGIKNPRDVEGRFINKYHWADQLVKALGTIWVATFITGFIAFGIWLVLVPKGQSGYIHPVQAQTGFTGANFSSSEALEVLVGTKMEESIPYIEKAAKYYDLPVTLYLGVANAESSFNNFKDGCHNPYGIGNNGPVCYSDWGQGVDEFSRLIKYYYYAEGKITPEQMRDKYVGYGIGSPKWADNVKVYYDPKIIIKFE